MLAVARSCLYGEGWLRHFIRAELPAWPTYQRGGGRAVLQAANAWASGRAPWLRGSGSGVTPDKYFDAGANGAAMRIAPHVIWALTNGDRQQLYARVVADATTTHGHPRAILGALALASALYEAATSDDTLHPDTLINAAYDAVTYDPDIHVLFVWDNNDRADWFTATWLEACNEMSQLLTIVSSSLNRGSMSNVSDTLDDLGAKGRYSGSGTISVAAALYLAGRAGSRPYSGLVQAAFEPGLDTDTVASMAASVLGAVHGVDWLSDADVQDREYIEKLADALCTPQAFELVEDSSLVPTRQFFRALDNEQAIGDFPDGRRFHRSESSVISESPWVIRHRLELSDGQTVVVDRTRRTPPVSPPAIDDDATTPSRVSVRVALPTANIAMTRNYYEYLLGRRLNGGSNSVIIDDGIIFEQVAEANRAWTADAQLTIRNKMAYQRALQFADAKERGNGVLTVRDPDGRILFITMT